MFVCLKRNMTGQYKQHHSHMHTNKTDSNPFPQSPPEQKSNDVYKQNYYIFHNPKSVPFDEKCISHLSPKSFLGKSAEQKLPRVNNVVRN